MMSHQYVEAGNNPVVSFGRRHYLIKQNEPDDVFEAAVFTALINENTGLDEDLDNIDASAAVFELAPDNAPNPPVFKPAGWEDVASNMTVAAAGTPPKGRPIIEPNDHDVRFGQGSGSNLNPGNIAYCEYVWSLQDDHPDYQSYSNDEKDQIYKQIVQHVCDEGARFVRPIKLIINNKLVRYWVLASLPEIRTKVSQCMRQPPTNA